MKAKYEVYRDEARKWRWRLRAANGQITASSGEAFATRFSAMRAVVAVKKSSSDASE